MKNNNNKLMLMVMLTASTSGLNLYTSDFYADVNDSNADRANLNAHHPSQEPIAIIASQEALPAIVSQAPQILQNASVNGVIVGSMIADKIIPVNSGNMVIEPGSMTGSIAMLENKGTITIKRKPKNPVAISVAVSPANHEILPNT